MVQRYNKKVKSEKRKVKNFFFFDILMTFFDKICAYDGLLLTFVTFLREILYTLFSTLH